jgi:hypothetical protein
MGRKYIKQLTRNAHGTNPAGQPCSEISAIWIPAIREEACRLQGNSLQKKKKKNIILSKFLFCGLVASSSKFIDLPSICVSFSL